MFLPNPCEKCEIISAQPAELGTGILPNRIVRDGILTSDAVCGLGPLAELFYRRLHSVVDDFGRYYAKPSILLSHCFPIRPSWANDETITEWVAECSSAGLINPYAVNGTNYLEIVKFGQRIRPGAKSKFPSSAESSGAQPLYAADFRESPSPAAESGSRAASPSTTPPSHTATSPTARIADLELFERMIGAFLAAGVALNEPDMLAAGTEWVSLPDAQHEPATTHAEAKARTTEARYMGLPANYLKKREWDRRGTGRLLPAIREPTKSEQATSKAAQNIREKGGMF